MARKHNPAREVTALKWLTILALSVSANLDNLAVGIAYGIARIVVPPGANLIIAAVAFAFTMLSGLAGHLLARVLPPYVPRLVATAALLLVGIWMFIEGLRLRQRNASIATAPRTGAMVCADSPGSATSDHPGWREILAHPEVADLDASRSINSREALLLGVATSVNCLVNGLAAPWMGVPLLWTAVATAGGSYLSLWLGGRMGQMRWSRYLGDWGGVVAGVLLMGLGIRQLF